MMHQMKLNNDPFEKIKNGTKTIELRLYDEKRKLLKINDVIELINISTNEQMMVQIENLYHYPSFYELYKHFDKIEIGYDQEEKPNYKDMEQYYSKEEQNEYGVLGIRIKKI